MSQAPAYFEVCVADRVRGVRIARDDADRLALGIACDELVDVEVRPVRSDADRKANEKPR